MPLFDLFLLSEIQLIDENLLNNKNKIKNKCNILYKYPLKDDHNNLNNDNNNNLNNNNIINYDKLITNLKTFLYPDINEIQLDDIYNQNKKIYNQNQSEHINFTLSTDEGYKRIIFCLRFISPSQTYKYPCGKRLKTTFCFVTSYPMMSFFQSILRELHGIWICDENNWISGEDGTLYIYNENHIHNHNQNNNNNKYINLREFLKKIYELNEMALPKPGNILSIDYNTDIGIKQFNYNISKNGVNSLDSSIIPLLSFLGPHYFLLLFTALLCERRIIFVSNKLNKLSNCMMSIYPLLYPFEWCHIHIPILPPSLISYVCAPMPFLIGILRDQLDEVKSLPISEVLLVDLDEGNISAFNDSHHEFQDGSMVKNISIIKKKNKKSAFSSLSSIVNKKLKNDQYYNNKLNDFNNNNNNNNNGDDHYNNEDDPLIIDLLEDFNFFSQASDHINRVFNKTKKFLASKLTSPDNYQNQSNNNNENNLLGNISGAFYNDIKKSFSKIPKISASTFDQSGFLNFYSPINKNNNNNNNKNYNDDDNDNNNNIKIAPYSNNFYSNNDDESEKILRNAILLFYIYLVGDHRTFIGGVPGKGLVIDKDYYLERRRIYNEPPNLTKFIKIFTRSQMFDHYCEYRLKERLFENQTSFNFSSPTSSLNINKLKDNYKNKNSPIGSPLGHTISPNRNNQEQNVFFDNNDMIDHKIFINCVDYIINQDYLFSVDIIKSSIENENRKYNTYIKTTKKRNFFNKSNNNNNNNSINENDINNNNNEILKLSQNIERNHILMNDMILNITSNSDNEYDENILNNLSNLLYDDNSIKTIMRVIIWRLMDCKGLRWKHGAKGLSLLYDLLLHGPLTMLSLAYDLLPYLISLQKYSSGIGFGKYIRKKARKLILLIIDIKRYKNTRQKLLYLENIIFNEVIKIGLEKNTMNNSPSMIERFNQIKLNYNIENRNENDSDSDYDIDIEKNFKVFNNDEENDETSIEIEYREKLIVPPFEYLHDDMKNEQKENQNQKSKPRKPSLIKRSSFSLLNWDELGDNSNRNDSIFSNEKENIICSPVIDKTSTKRSLDFNSNNNENFAIFDSFNNNNNENFANFDSFNNNDNNNISNNFPNFNNKIDSSNPFSTDNSNNFADFDVRINNDISKPDPFSTDNSNNFADFDVQNNNDNKNKPDPFSTDNANNFADFEVQINDNINKSDPFSTDNTNTFADFDVQNNDNIIKSDPFSITNSNNFADFDVQNNENKSDPYSTTNSNNFTDFNNDANPFSTDNFKNFNDKKNDISDPFGTNTINPISSNNNSINNSPEKNNFSSPKIHVNVTSPFDAFDSLSPDINSSPNNSPVKSLPQTLFPNVTNNKNSNNNRNNNSNNGNKNNDPFADLLSGF